MTPLSSCEHIVDFDENSLFLHFFNQHQQMFNPSATELVRRSKLQDAPATIMRILRSEAPLTVTRAKRLTVAAARDFQFDWDSLWLHLSGGRTTADNQFTEIELATIERHDPARAKAIAGLLRDHQRRASDVIWFSRGFPAALFPRPELVRKAVSASGGLVTHEKCDVGRFLRRLARLQNVQLSEGCGLPQQRILVPIFRKEFERFVRQRPPFNQFTAGEVLEAVEYAAHDLAERNVLIAIIDQGRCPQRLKRHFRRFTSTIGMPTLLLRQSIQWPGSLLYRRGAKDSVNDHIDAELGRLNRLLQFCDHELNPLGVTKRLELYAERIRKAPHGSGPLQH